METTAQDESQHNDLLKQCFNCHELMAEEANFCPNCGQKYTTGRATVKELFDELIELVLNIDSKIFRTLAALFIPGKLTLEYFKGRHKRYIHPVRLFFVLTVLLLASISFLLDEDSINVGNLQEQLKLEYEQHQWYLNLDTTRMDVAAQFNNNPQVVAALDTLVAKLPDRNAVFKDSISLAEEIDIFKGVDFKVATIDFINLSPDQLIEKYKVEGFWNQILWKQQLKLAQRGNNFILYLIGKTSWMVLLLMPFLALVLKLLYIRRGFYYIEHLVFSFHVHALFFLILTVQFILNGYLPDWLYSVTIPGIAVYIVIAMKKVYKQGWWKTIFKFCIANFIYLVLLCFTAVATFFIGFFLF